MITAEACVRCEKFVGIVKKQRARQNVARSTPTHTHPRRWISIDAESHGRPSARVPADSLLVRAPFLLLCACCGVVCACWCCAAALDLSSPCPAASPLGLDRREIARTLRRFRNQFHNR